MSDKFYSLKVLLLEFDEYKSITIDRLKSSFKNFDVLETLVISENLGFISRLGGKDSSSFTEASWKITDKGKFFLKMIKTAKNKDFDIIMTIPPQLQKDTNKKFPNIKSTKEAFDNIIKETSSEIRIFSPYVDASFIPMVEQVEPTVSIKIITAYSKYSSKNPILERLKSRGRIGIKYLGSVEGDVQLFQLHAKIFISDNKKLYIGSANLKETSIFYNLEAGIIIDDSEAIDAYKAIFDYFYEIAK